MDGKLILLVEDVKEVQNYNKSMLEMKGFIVETAMTLADARARLARQTPDIIVLDRGMPDGEGLDLLKELRASGSSVPVLVLTGYSEKSDVITGFETGCDDYLSKPYVFEELLIRLTRLLKTADRLPERITKGELALNLTSMIALLRGEDIMLTQKEFALLLLFTQNEGKTLGVSYIYERVWGREMNWDVRAVQQRISTLREKIEGCGYIISSVRTEGYRFEREL